MIKRTYNCRILPVLLTYINADTENQAKIEMSAVSLKQERCSIVKQRSFISSSWAV